MLSPNTTKALIAEYGQPYQNDSASTSSESPDSLYSNGSPVFEEQVFEYDTESMLDVREAEEEDYDRMIEGTGVNDIDVDEWTRWPETGRTSPGWSPSPKSGTSRKGSIISIASRGSLSLTARRDSLPIVRLRSQDSRRDSDPSLLGFELQVAQRRRSSTKSPSSSRRRSSAQSSSSIMDPAEDLRLRNIASMDALSRRFSEVVEVTCPSSESEDDSNDDMIRARNALRGQSEWSDDSADDDDSEIHTAPYFPTPEMSPTSRPTLLSNYPLPSAVLDRPIDTPSDFTPESSPAPRQLRIPRPASHVFVSTPPPPAQPLDIIRQRKRPAYPRAVTNYEFPPRSEGVPLGAAPPRPLLHRATSTPFFSEPQKAQDIAVILERRAAGTFPLARSVPLGVSPLRESLRRESVADGMDDRRSSLGDRRPSALRDGPTGRRFSSEIRRRSSGDIASRTNSRKSSANLLLHDRKLSSQDGRRDSSSSSLRRSSQISRKSSVVSIGEYGYLGPQIVIDSAASSVSNDTPAPQLPTLRSTPSIFRENAPASIALPTQPYARSVQTLTGPITPNTPGSRYNPLDSFFGRHSDDLSTPTLNSHRGLSLLGAPPLSPNSESNDKTPLASSSSIMDRGRPVASPTFVESFSPKSVRSPTAKTFTSPTLSPFKAPSQLNTPDLDDSPPSPKQMPSNASTPVERIRLGSVRVAVPKLSQEDMRQMFAESLAENHDGRYPNTGRRGATEHFGPVDQLASPIRVMPSHRRTESAGVSFHPSPSVKPTPPALKRQSTMDIPSGSTSASRQTDNVITKRASATFTHDNAAARPQVMRSMSNSTFWFFNKKTSPKEGSVPKTATSPNKPIKPILRTKDSSSSSSGSDTTQGDGHGPAERRERSNLRLN